MARRGLRHPTAAHSGGMRMAERRGDGASAGSGRPGGTGLAEALIGEIGFLRSGGRVRSGGSGRDSGLGSGPSASARAKAMWQLSQSSNAVVLKKIARGGTGNAASLKVQMNYLFGKSEAVFGNMVGHDPEARSLTGEERDAVVADWSEGWRGAPKNGHTTHLMISFPDFVKPAKAALIAEAWAAEMFQSGTHQAEEWAYVAALHADRAHAHVHIVVNNRGLVNEDWFYMAKDHAFNLAVMKERLALIAEEEGVYLDCSSRRDRGILSYGPNRAEIERARREARLPRETPLSGRVLEAALADLQTNADVLKDLAMVADLTGLGGVASQMRAASDVLRRGGIVHPFLEAPDLGQGEAGMGPANDGRGLEATPGRGVMAERSDADAATGAASVPATRRGLEQYFSDWLARTEEKIAGLSPERQAPLWRELRDIASDVVRTLGDSRGAELMKEAPVAKLHAASLEERPDGRATLKVGPEERVLGTVAKDQMMTALRAAATEAGIDAGRMEAQLQRPAASAFQERDRVKADLRDVATRQSLQLETEEGRREGAKRVDAFYEKAAQILDKTLGIDRDRPEVSALPKALKAMADVRSEVGMVRFESEAQARAFAGDMEARYGKDVIRDLARGKDEALARDFPDATSRAAVVRAVMAAAISHETISLPLAEATRGEKLWAEKTRDLERGGAATERERVRDRSRDREM